MGKTTLVLLPFPNIYKNRVGATCFRLSMRSVHCTWRCWQAQLVRRARCKQFHINPPVQFWFSRLFLNSIFPDFLRLAPTTSQRISPILQTVNVTNFWPKNLNKQLHPRGQVTTQAPQIDLINPASRRGDTSKSQNYVAVNPLFGAMLLFQCQERHHTMLCVWDHHMLSDKPATGENWPGATNNRNISELLLHYAEIQQG